MNRKYKSEAKKEAGQNAAARDASRFEEMKKDQMNRYNVGVTPAVTATSHNVLGVTNTGSPVSTQVWGGGFKNAVRTALDWYEAGEKWKLEESPWQSPILHVYVYQHKTEDTYFYDLTNPEHLATLRAAAK